MGRLDHKSILVTGGARGIGRAIVEKCAEEGGLVSYFDTNEAAGLATADDIAGTGRTVEFYRVDVTREDDVERGVASVAQRHGRVDVLVNNASMNAYFDPVEMTEAQWGQGFAVDLKGAWLCARAVLPGMRARHAGSIVNIASAMTGASIAVDCGLGIQFAT